MPTKVSNGIRISVTPIFRELHSSEKNFYFSYKVAIENHCDCAVQLMKRHWHIFDSIAGFSEVEGEGVVGEQPVLLPGEVYEYESGCQLSSPIGKMHGSYGMVKLKNGAEFSVTIPEFCLIAPFKMN